MTITEQLVKALEKIIEMNRKEGGFDSETHHEWDGPIGQVARDALAAYEASKNQKPPTIAELEAILNSEGTEPVQIMPDGSVAAYEASKAEGQGEGAT